MPRLFVYLVLGSMLLSACAGNSPITSPESVVTDIPAATEIQPTMAVSATTAAEPGTPPY